MAWVREVISIDRVFGEVFFLPDDILCMLSRHPTGNKDACLPQATGRIGFRARQAWFSTGIHPHYHHPYQADCSWKSLGMVI